MRPKIKMRNGKGRDSESPMKAFDRAQNEVFIEHNLDILVIKNYEDVKIPTLAAYDVVIIDYYSEKRANELLNAIRGSVYEEVYLKPCFLLTYEKKVRQVDQALADGALEQRTITPYLNKIEGIIKTTEEILQVKSDFNGRKVLLRLLRFLHSRKQELYPVPLANSLTGYSYPFLEANIPRSDYQELIDTLQAGEDRGLLNAEFEDTLHLCSNCNGGFINFREICPKCNTRKHHSQHTIHHFVCGYVGPESDFKRENRLVCPKCDRQLRHIGVDYDKPSLVMECENGHIFQEPKMQTFCFNCEDENEIESLVEFTVSRYSLTASGANVAMSGAEKKESREQLEGFVSLSVFKTFLKVEIERQRASKKPGSVTYFNLLLSPTTLKGQQNNYDEFSHEVAKLVKNQLKPTEIVTFLNDDVFLVITPEENAAVTHERFKSIEKNLLGVIRNNFGGDEQDRIFHESFELDAEKGGDSIMSQINERITIF